MEKYMFSYIDHAWEIFTVAEGLPCDLGEAWDRFRADVADGKANDFNTAGLLPDFDFAAAGAAWDALDEDGQEAVRAQWRAFAGDRARVLTLIGFYRENDREGFELAAELWRQSLEQEADA